MLQEKDLDKVAHRFRDMVLEAWKRGEDIPYSIINLSDKNITQKELDRVDEIVKFYNLED